MKAKNYKIDFEIYLVFIIVISISVFNAIYSSMNISRNQDVTSRIMTVDIPSLQKLENMNLVVTRSKMFTTNWVYLQSNKEDKDKLRVLQNVEYPALKRSINSLMLNWNDKVEVDSMRVVFAEFEKLMVYQKQVMNTLTNFDDYEDPMKRFTSEEIVENQVLPQSAKIMSQLNQIILKKKAKTDLMHDDVKSSSRAMMWSVLGIAILIVIVILIAAFYISDHIIVPTMKLKNYVLQMGKGEIPEMDIKTGKNAIGQMTDAVKSLSVSLKQTAQFAHKIGDGNLGVDFQPLSTNDELGNALLQMRASLRFANEQNRQRTWISTGMEKINEAVRENTDNLDNLSEGIITILSWYLEILQGGFYLVDDDDSQQIRLQGHFAFDKAQCEKVILQRGEGLVGQAIKDGQIVHLKNVTNQTKVMSTGIASIVPSH